jgi:hypothetical protein
MMSEVRFAVGDADAGLRERLDEEISAFNAAVTHHDGGLLSVAARGDGGDLCGGLYGWTWAGVATSTCSGCETTSAVMAWEPGSWPWQKPRSCAAAVTGWR